MFTKSCVYHPQILKSVGDSVVFRVEQCVPKCDWYRNGVRLAYQQDPILEFPLVSESLFGVYEAFYCDVDGAVSSETFFLQKPHPLQIEPCQLVRQDRSSLPQQIQPFNPSLLQSHEGSQHLTPPLYSPHPPKIEQYETANIVH